MATLFAQPIATGMPCAGRRRKATARLARTAQWHLACPRRSDGSANDRGAATAVGGEALARPARTIAARASTARHALCSQRCEETFDMKSKVAPYAENFCESGIACLLTMVQGNVLVLGLSHWIAASRTGLLAGAIVGTTVLVAKPKRPWIVALVLGGVTTLVDMAVHPASLGLSSLGEAAITGAGALVLSLGAGSAARRIVRRRAARLRPVVHQTK
jgi:hypothetical protein